MLIFWEPYFPIILRGTILSRQFFPGKFFPETIILGDNSSRRQTNWERNKYDLNKPVHLVFFNREIYTLQCSFYIHSIPCGFQCLLSLAHSQFFSRLVFCCNVFQAYAICIVTDISPSKIQEYKYWTLNLKSYPHQTPF